MSGLRSPILTDGILEPLFHVIQHIHGDRVDHGYLSVIVFEYEYHIKVLQMKLNSFEMNEFDLFQCDDERRLKVSSMVSNEAKDAKQEFRPNQSN